MYRSIETSIWSDPVFKKLPSPSKLGFLYLITNQHAHVSGIYLLAKEIIVLETKLQADMVDRVVHTLSESGLVFHDEMTEVFWVKNMLMYQGAHSKLFAAAANHVRTLHNSSLIQKFLAYYPQVAKRLKAKGTGRVSKPRRASLQEQEQEQEKDKKNGARAVDAGITDEQWANRIYENYPRKVDRGHALSAIRAAINRIAERPKDNSADWLLVRTIAYCGVQAAAAERDPERVKTVTPHPATWFNGHRYDDSEAEWLRSLQGITGGPRNGTRKPSAAERGEYAEQLPLEVRSLEPDGDGSAARAVAPAAPTLRLAQA